MNPKLKAAILIWKRGDRIALDHAVALMSLGYDVEALEGRYLAQ
jgi:hypothetical protein